VFGFVPVGVCLMVGTIAAAAMIAFGLFHLVMVWCGYGGLDVGLVQAVSR